MLPRSRGTVAPSPALPRLPRRLSFTLPSPACGGGLGWGERVKRNHNNMRETEKPLQAFARALRADATNTERTLWQRLRRQQLGGYRFRRQVIIQSYIADFACLERKLVVELDGGQHMEATQQDRKRDTALQTHGYRVMRFWNNEVMENMEGVLERILEALNAPHPNPPPHAGEGMDEANGLRSPRPEAAPNLPAPPRGEHAQPSPACGGGQGGGKP
jgi:very-short-patch-repair endonuclease